MGLGSGEAGKGGRECGDTSIGSNIDLTGVRLVQRPPQVPFMEPSCELGYEGLGAGANL